MLNTVSCTSKEQNYEYQYQWCPPEDPIYLPETKPRGRAESADERNLPNFTPTCVKSSFINFTPSILRFPYNDPGQYNQRLTLWNRSLNALRIRISAPDPETFLIQVHGLEPRSLHQLCLQGGEAKTLLIRCNPGRYKMAKSHLLLFLKTPNDECECHHFPLEIFPSIDWFSLPKKIIIPEVIVGQKAHAIITLPQPKYEEKFFVIFQPSFIPNDAVTLTPMEGRVGGKNGIRKLKVTYAPTEYTTVACTIQVHFPGLSSMASHEIQILARCKPGKEADNIRKEIREIETFRPKPTKKNRLKPRIKLRTRLRVSSSAFDQVDYNVNKAGRKKSYLFTMAGVMHFLTRKHVPEMYAQESKRRSGVELLTSEAELQPEEKIEIYEDMKKRLDLSSDQGSGNGEGDQDPEKRQKLKTYQKKDWDELQKLVGVPLFGKAEKTPDSGENPSGTRGSYLSDNNSHNGERRTLRGSQRASISSHRSDYTSMMTKAHRSVSEEERQTNKNIVDEEPGPRQKFIQAVTTVITRWRANKRIEKLHELMEDKMGKRKKSRKSIDPKRVSIAQGKKSLNMKEPPSIAQERKSNTNMTEKSIAKAKKSVIMNEAPIVEGRKSTIENNHSVEADTPTNPTPKRRSTKKKSMNPRSSHKNDV